jgi:hypothetical protein
MAGWRTLGTLVLALGSTVLAQAQTYSLKEPPLTGSYFHVHMHMALAGELKIHQAGKVNPLKQEASADHDFLERVLEADAAGPARKVVRVYKQARADITTAGQASHRTLRPEQASLVVAQCYKEQPLTYAPKGPFTRAELELVQHFDTMHLPGLLPEKDVTVGETWKLPNGVAQALCAFEGLTSHDLTCKLERVQDGVALLSISGTASGIDLGAAVQLKITGTGRFDLARHRLTALEWKQHDQRDQGPASPALEADMTVTLTRDPTPPADELNDLILALLPTGTVPDSMTALWHRDPQHRYELTYARDWQIVARDEAHLVLRLLDRGEFVAQATLTWWKKAAPGQHLSPEEFKQAMSESPGWVEEKQADAREAEAPTGHWLYRIESVGQLGGLNALQYFYLLAGPQGEQMVLTFTMTPNQAQKLATRDLALVHGVVFP